MGDETKHTPLPWKVDGPSRDVLRGARGVEVNSDESVGWLAIVQVGFVREGEANADFIVRACNAHYELLEALDKINTAACYASEENTDSREEMLLFIGNTARAAISKATGKD